MKRQINEYHIAYTVVGIFIYFNSFINQKKECNQKMRISVDNKDNAPFVYLAVEFAKPC